MEHIPVETKDFLSPSVFFISPSLFVNEDIGKDDETQKIKQNTWNTKMWKMQASIISCTSY